MTVLRSYRAAYPGFHSRVRGWRYAFHSEHSSRGHFHVVTLFIPVSNFLDH